MKQACVIGLSPNLEKDDFQLTLKSITQIHSWQKGDSIKELEDWFKKYFNTAHVFSLNSGRSALYILLQNLGLTKGDEIIIQAFTCVAVPEVIKWSGGTPVFVDVEKDSYNLDPQDLISKITPRTKAIIIQHTFGIPAKITKISEIAQKNNLLLIEDCAHALGATVNNKKIGTFGDAAVFSFGRDKVVSSVFGGVLILNDSLKNLAPKIARYINTLQRPNSLWILQQLLHPVITYLLLYVYNINNLGKILLIFFQKFRLISMPIEKPELDGHKPSIFPQKFPNILACLANNQLTKLDKFNRKRRAVAKLYGKIEKGSIYLRYPILINDPATLYEYAKKNNIVLGRWYSNIVDPKGTNLQKMNYRHCPNAESVASRVIER